MARNLSVIENQKKMMLLEKTFEQLCKIFQAKQEPAELQTMECVTPCEEKTLKIPGCCCSRDTICMVASCDNGDAVAFAVGLYAHIHTHPNYTMHPDSHGSQKFHMQSAQHANKQGCMSTFG